MRREFVNVPDDYRWLTSDAARPWLERARETDSPVALTKQMRRETTAERARLVLELTELRRRAQAKFPDAERLFFTRTLLEQATDDAIARYKASRFAGRSALSRPVFDLCCGLGGDLLALGALSPVLGVDRAPIAAWLSAANATARGLVGATTRCDDVTSIHLEPDSAWHIDPDRRAAETRTAQPHWSEPAPEVIDALRARAPQVAVKLAPAAEVPASWTAGEREWIGSRGECRQQVVWFGDLAEHPGLCRATIVAGAGSPSHDVANSLREMCLSQTGVNGTRLISRSEMATPSIVGQPDEEVPLAEQPGRLLFEPHAAVLAAGLEGALAQRHGWQSVAPGAAYLTGDAVVDEPLVSTFEVREILPLDERRLRRWLREQGIGTVEVKKRGVRLEPDRWRRILASDAPGRATLLVFPWRGRVVAAVAQRLVREVDVAES